MTLGTTLQRFLILAMICLLLVAGFIGLASMERSGSNARSLILKAVEAHGGEAALRKARTGTTKGVGAKHTGEGRTLPFEWEEAFDRADKLRTTIRGRGQGGVVTQVYLLPADEWWQKQGDGPFERRGEAPQRVESYLSPLHKLLQVKNDELPAVRLGEEEVGGAKAAHVEVVSPDWGAVIFYFDLASGRLVKLSKQLDLEDPKSIVMSKEFAQFRLVDGVLVPARVVELQNDTPDRELTLLEATLGNKFEGSLFKKP